MVGESAIAHADPGPFTLAYLGPTGKNASMRSRSVGWCQVGGSSGDAILISYTLSPRWGLGLAEAGRVL